MSNKKLFISINSLEEFQKRVRKAFKRVEAGLPLKEPNRRLSFVNEAIFFKTLSPKRMELIKFLKKSGPLSRRQLSIKLNRAYANVHDDVKALVLLGLIKKNAEQKLFVPWDEINISLKLAA